MLALPGVDNSLRVVCDASNFAIGSGLVLLLNHCAKMVKTTLVSVLSIIILTIIKMVSCNVVHIKLPQSMNGYNFYAQY